MLLSLLERLALKLAPDENDGSLLGGGGESAQAPEGGEQAPESIWGASQPKFPEFFPQEFREEPMFKSFVDKEGEVNMGSIIKSFAHAQKNVGRNKVVIPDHASASPAELDEFHAKLGYEADAEKYQVSAAEDSKIEGDFVNGFKELAHKSRIPHDKAQELFNYVEGQVDSISKAQLEAKSAAQETEIAGLKEEWGAAYDSKLAFAQELVKNVGGEATGKFFSENPELGNNVGLTKFLAQVGEKMFGNDNHPGDANSSNNGMFSPLEATNEIGRVMGDKNHAYNNPSAFGHKEAVQTVLNLHKMAKGQK